MQNKTALDLFNEAREAMARAEWELAREKLRQSLSIEETPEAFEELAWATWWLDNAAGTLEARERAYQAYIARNEPLSAARSALWLCVGYIEFRGEFAVANGWLQHTRRLLQGFEQTPEAAWLAFLEGHLAINAEKDVQKASSQAEQTIAIGRTLKNIDLEMLGLALKGYALVFEGHVLRG